MTTDVVTALADELRLVLGARGVSTDLRTRERASVDEAAMSPILAARLPLGLADLVAYPRDAEQIAEVVAAAVRHGVGVTPRGKGTGNYGQAIPLHGGLVLDTSRAATVHEVGEGYVVADAGAKLLALENAARKTGQELLMYPSTAQSTIGGFLSGGSGGTGSIEHGINQPGFALALDVVHASGEPSLVHVEGADAQPYVHTYGTAGIIARVKVRLAPARHWQAFYASFPDFHQALELLRSFAALRPTPRLVSADTSVVAETLPADPAIPAGRASLRAILAPEALADATALVTAAGGRAEEVREGAQATVRLSTLSYNHPIYWLQRSRLGPWFHLEVGGDALVDRIDEVHAVFPGGVLHAEAQRAFPIGMLAAPYESPAQVAEGAERLRALGVRVHSPHDYHVDHNVEETRALAAVTDPLGLLNPGKLPAGAVAHEMYEAKL